MSSRFTHRLTSRSSSGPAGNADKSTCQGCLATHKARERSFFDPLPGWHSPLTPGVQCVNLSRSEDGRKLHVKLGHDWPRMFTQLSDVGTGLVMAGNDALILARRGRYPDLCVTGNGAHGPSTSGSLEVDFRLLGAARAIHLRGENGQIFGVEFCDEIGRTVHRLTLTPESDFDAFFEWVRLHQACTAEGIAPCEEFDETVNLAELHTVLRRSDPGAVSSVLAACCDGNVNLRVTVQVNGVRQCATFTPQSFVRDDGWWFASSDEAGLHFNPARLAMVEVVRTGETVGDGPALRARTEDGWLRLEGAGGDSAAGWEALLNALA